MKAVDVCSCSRLFLAIVEGLAPTLVISHPFRLMMGKNLSRRAILFIYEFLQHIAYEAFPWEPIWFVIEGNIFSHFVPFLARLVALHLTPVSK